MRTYRQALLAMLRREPEDLVLFASDVLWAIPHGMTALRGEVTAWHHTVQAWQDPIRLAQLTAPLDPDDFVEVSRPRG